MKLYYPFKMQHFLAISSGKLQLEIYTQISNRVKEKKIIHGDLQSIKHSPNLSHFKKQINIYICPKP